MRCPQILTPCLLVVAALTLAMADNQSGESNFTADFGIHAGDTLLPTGGNQYFSLNPGAFMRLEGEDDGQEVLVEITVLNKTKQVHFPAEGGMMTVKARVVEEREWVNGELAQVSLNYFAASPTTGNIYNFGEKVNHYLNGVIVGHADSWLAGKNGARPGLLLPGFFLLGSRYYQELAPGASMDRAKNVGMGLTFETPAGTFENCIVVRETSPLEPDEEVLKVYAPGVGLIIDDQLELVAYHQ